MLPMRNPWNYIVDRVDLRRECFFEELNAPCERVVPCDQVIDDTEPSCSSSGRFARLFKKCIKGTHVWGNYIYEIDNAGSDGNAHGYRIQRSGVAVGVDRDIKNSNTWIGMMFAYDNGRLNVHSNKVSGAKSDDFNIGLYHRTLFQKGWEWKNYLGMGYQRYNMWRNVDLGLTNLVWDPSLQFYTGKTEEYTGQFGSRFNGYSMALSTELARPFFCGENDRWFVRPYMALDVNGFWQGSASEDPNSFAKAHYLALDYHRTNDIRTYWRPGLQVERGGPRGSIRGQVAYSFRIGGRGYTSVDNQFQYGGESFNMRGVDDGIGFVTVNLGTSLFLDKKKTSLATFDYWLFSGGASTTQALQLGAQKQF